MTVVGVLGRSSSLGIPPLRGCCQVLLGQTADALRVRPGGCLTISRLRLHCVIPSQQRAKSSNVLPHAAEHLYRSTETVCHYCGAARIGMT